MNKVYIVIVQPISQQNSYVSAEGYKTFEEAVAFIKGRSDRPVQVFNWQFESKHNIYFIREVLIRG